MRETYLNVGKLLLFLGVLLLAIKYLPWNSLPPSLRPWLLILLGVVLLLMGVMIRKVEKDTTKELIKIGAGVITALALAVIVTLGPLMLAQVVGFNAVEPAPTTSSILREVPCAGKLDLQLETTSMDVRVVKWNGSTVKVLLEAPENVIGDLKESISIDQEERDGVTVLTIRSEESRVHVVVTKWFQLFTPKISLEVRVPEGCSLQNVDLRTVSGDVRLETDSERVRIMTTSGDVAILGEVGSMDVTTVSGDVELRVTLKSHGSLETTSGDVNCRLKVIGAGSLSVHTTSGDTNLDLSREGDIGLRVSLNTLTGELSMKGLEVEESREGFGAGKELVGRAEGAGARFLVLASSVSGDIRVNLSP